MAASQMSLLLALLVLTTSTSALPTIHEVLQGFGFPPGLLPDSVDSYSIYPEGFGFAFVIKIKNPCYVKYDDFDVYFKPEITGVISTGHITQLNGVESRGLLVFDIQLRPDNILRFNLVRGFIFYLDVKPFESIPTCKDEVVAAFDPSSKHISELPVTTA